MMNGFLLFACAAAAAACAAAPLPGLAGEEEAPRTHLEVTSTPNGATVWVDHVNRGVTPLTLSDLKEGPCLLRVSREGYVDAFESVSIEAGKVRRASFALARQTGLLLVVTDPPGCEVSEAGVSLGTSPLLLTSLPTGKHRLTVASPGFQTKSVDLTLEGRAPLRQEVRLLSDSGALRLTSDPPGAAALVNGILRGQTPCTVDRIPAGQANLEVKADGFKPYAREIALAAGEVRNVDVRLAPLPATLRIVSIPEGARVYVNNEFKGLSPYDLTDLPPGEYRVRLDLAGCDPSARTVLLEKGASVTEEFRLSRNTGRLEVITAPAGATILVDGKKRGRTATEKKTETTSVSDPLQLEGIAEGGHVIEVVRKGFSPQKRKITVTRGATLTLQFSLERQFIPDYEVTTTRSRYTGVLQFISADGIRLEIAPGVTTTIPMKDVKKHGFLREEGK